MGDAGRGVSHRLPVRGHGRSIYRWRGIQSLQDTPAPDSRGRRGHSGIHMVWRRFSCLLLRSASDWENDHKLMENTRFMWLGRNFNYSSAILSLATKVVVNQLVFTPIFNSYFFSMQSLLAGSTVKEAYERVRNTLPTSFVNSCKLWPAVTAFSFWYIQPQFRFLFAGKCPTEWTVGTRYVSEG